MDKFKEIYRHEILHIKALELNGTADMQEALDEWIDDVMGGSPDEFNYRADLTNHITGITVSRSKGEAENG